jgi:hypothetical protein
LEVLKAAKPLLDFFREELKNNPPTTATAFDGYVILTFSDGTRTQLGEGKDGAAESGSITPTSSIKI